MNMSDLTISAVPKFSLAEYQYINSMLNVRQPPTTVESTDGRRWVLERNGGRNVEYRVPYVSLRRGSTEITLTEMNIEEVLED